MQTTRTSMACAGIAMLVTSAAMGQVPRGGWVTGTDLAEQIVFDGNFQPLGWGLGGSGASVMVDNRGEISYLHNHNPL